LFQKVHPHHVKTSRPEFFAQKGPPSLRDDRSARFFCSKRLTPITWSKKFPFRKVRPHHVMTGLQESFVSESPPSSHDDRSMLKLCQKITQHLSVRFSRFAAFLWNEAFVAMTGCLYPQSSLWI
jgi:hypothetical protein